MATSSSAVLLQLHTCGPVGAPLNTGAVCRIINIVIAEPSIGQDEQSSFNITDGTPRLLCLRKAVGAALVSSTPDHFRMVQALE